MSCLWGALALHACRNSRRVPSQLLQVIDSNLVHGMVSLPGSNTKKHLQEGQHAASQLFQQKSLKLLKWPNYFPLQTTCHILHHKWILWCWRWNNRVSNRGDPASSAPISLFCTLKLLIWLDQRKTKPHSCWPLHFNRWRLALLAFTENPQ